MHDLTFKTCTRTEICHSSWSPLKRLSKCEFLSLHQGTTPVCKSCGRSYSMQLSVQINITVHTYVVTLLLYYIAGFTVGCAVHHGVQFLEQNKTIHKMQICGYQEQHHLVFPLFSIFMVKQKIPKYSCLKMYTILKRVCHPLKKMFSNQQLH